MSRNHEELSSCVFVFFVNFVVPALALAGSYCGKIRRMKFKLLALIAATSAVVASVSLRGAAPAGPVEFTPHDIDANFRGGYSVSVADFNKDGKIDVIANSLQVAELAWYENPSWERHVVVPET